MGIAIDALVSCASWPLAVIVGLPVAGKIIAIAVALRGTEPKDRAQIITAVAELFRTRRSELLRGRQKQ